MQPCRKFCSRVHDVCGDEIRGLRSFTELLEVEITFDCETLPEPNGGDAPECYEQSGEALGLEQSTGELLVYAMLGELRQTHVP